MRRRPAPRLADRGDAARSLRRAGARLPSPPPLLSPFEREVILSASRAICAEEGLEPPFPLRPGLIAEMLALYDQSAAWADGRRLRAELPATSSSPSSDIDRGAAQLFAADALSRRGLSRLRGADRAATARLTNTVCAPGSSSEPAARPIERVVVTVADRLAESDGLWPADFDLLTRVPGLARSIWCAPKRCWRPGFLERLHAALARARGGIRPAESAAASGPARAAVVGPEPERRSPAASVLSRSRRRAGGRGAAPQGRHRAGAAAPLHRTALVVRRPLPYLYLARDVFADAAHSVRDARHAAAGGRAVRGGASISRSTPSASDFTRATLLALLRSPHFRFDEPTRAPMPRDGRWMRDRAAMLRSRRRAISAASIGSKRSAARWSAITRAGVARRTAAADRAPGRCSHARRRSGRLQPLAQKRPLIEQIADADRVAAIASIAPPVRPTIRSRSRRPRVSAAVLGALDALGGAYARSRSRPRPRDVAHADRRHPALARQPDVCDAHRRAGAADRGRAGGTLRRLRRCAGGRADRRRMARTRPAQRAVSQRRFWRCSSRCPPLPIRRAAIATRSQRHARRSRISCWLTGTRASGCRPSRSKRCGGRAVAAAGRCLGAGA